MMYVSCLRIKHCDWATENMRQLRTFVVSSLSVPSELFKYVFSHVQQLSFKLKTQNQMATTTK